MSVSTGGFADYDSLLHWRQNQQLSGYNVLFMGIWYESLIRWIGPATKVMAMTRTFVTQRYDANGLLHAVTVPDHVDILCEMACGAQAHLRFSDVTGLAPQNQIWLFGDQGTLCLDTSDMTLYGATRGDGTLAQIPISADAQGQWRVEEEFINAIRGKEKVTLSPFEVGVQYMEFTEAVTRSAQTHQAISLPL